jgi:hypothetical protein
MTVKKSCPMSLSNYISWGFGKQLIDDIIFRNCCSTCLLYLFNFKGIILLVPTTAEVRYAYLNPYQEKSDDVNHNYKQPYECENCDFKNELYWCGGHFYTMSLDKRTTRK